MLGAARALRALEPAPKFYPLRALAGVHRMVLDGSAPDLRAALPVGRRRRRRPGRVACIREALAAHDPDVLADLRHPLQTNETSRCGALAGGFHVIAAAPSCRCGRSSSAPAPASTCTSTATATRAAGSPSGPADSPVRFVDYWRGGVPPLDEGRAPGASRLRPRPDRRDDRARAGSTLLSYVMPDELRASSTMRGALEVAATRPGQIDEASADDVDRSGAGRRRRRDRDRRLPLDLLDLSPGRGDRPYRGDDHGAGERADAEAPLLWLRYEQSAELGAVELRLRAGPATRSSCWPAASTTGRQISNG